jgi:hypothetical protein
MTLNRGNLEDGGGFWERLTCSGGGTAYVNAVEVAQTEGRNVY